MKRVLDVCCGGRMFWFNRTHDSVVFMDIRNERHELPDSGSPGGIRKFEVIPEILGDFRNIPFADSTFDMVVFDPPHFIHAGESSWLNKKYGTLSGASWKDDLSKGFQECFRVCRVGGTVIFKWNELQIATKDILRLTEREPLFFNRFGKKERSQWIVFMKEDSHDL